MSEQLKQSEQEQGLYMLKALLALFVVIIHVPMFGKSELKPLLSAAVPCFYIISGFFLYRGDRIKEIHCAWRWCKKIFTISVLVNLFYFIYWGVQGTWRYKAFCHAFLSGDLLNAALWYLTAMWQGLLAFILIRRFVSSKVIYLLPLLIIFSLLEGRFHFLFEDGGAYVPQWHRLNFFAVALPCLSVGYLLRKHVHRLKNLYVAIAFFVFFVVCGYAEDWIISIYVKKIISYGIFTIPVAICLFLIFLNLKKVRLSFISDIGKYHSANIYYFHVFVRYIVLEIEEYAHINAVSVRALIVYGLSIVVSIAVNWLCVYVKKFWEYVYNAKC